MTTLLEAPETRQPSPDPDLAGIKWTDNVQSVDPETSEEVLADFALESRVALAERVRTQCPETSPNKRDNGPTCSGSARRPTRFDMSVARRRAIRRAKKEIERKQRQQSPWQKLPRIDAAEIRSLSARVARIMLRLADGATNQEATEPEGVRPEAADHIFRVFSLKKAWLQGGDPDSLRYWRLMEVLREKVAQ